MDRAEGNPLYAIETVRAMHDQGLTADGPTRRVGAVRLATGVDTAALSALALTAVAAVSSYDTASAHPVGASHAPHHHLLRPATARQLHGLHFANAVTTDAPVQLRPTLTWMSSSCEDTLRKLPPHQFNLQCP